MDQGRLLAASNMEVDGMAPKGRLHIELKQIVFPLGWAAGTYTASVHSEGGTRRRCCKGFDGFLDSFHSESLRSLRIAALRGDDSDRPRLWDALGHLFVLGSISRAVCKQEHHYFGEGPATKPSSSTVNHW